MSDPFEPMFELPEEEEGAEAGEAEEGVLEGEGWPEAPTLEPEKPVKRGGAWPEAPALAPEELALKSRIETIWVGSGALKMALKMFEGNTDLLLNHVHFFINTNVFELSRAYQRLTALMREQTVMEAEPVVGWREFRRCFIPIGPRRCRGAGKNPARGFQMFSMNASNVLKLLYWAFDRFNCEGVVVVWCAGGGTGTLIGPYIAARLARRLRPLAYVRGAGTALLPVMTLPLRTAESVEVRNAKLSVVNVLKYQREEPAHHPVVLDLEVIARQLGLSVRKLPEQMIYDKCDELITSMLATLLRCLEQRENAYPSWDWSDLYDILANAPRGGLGSMFYISYDRLRGLEKGWKRDLWLSMTLYGSVLDGGTATLFLLGKGITKKLHDDMASAIEKRLKLSRLLRTRLEVENKWEALLLHFGTDARTIQPPLEVGRR